MGRLTNIDIEISLSEAIYFAKRSGIKSFQTGATIKYKNKTLGTGWSHYSERNLSRYRSIHAELAAILRTPKSRLEGSTIFIATIRRKSGNIGLAKPCQACLDLLYEVGIHDIHYTVEKGIYHYLQI